MRSWEAKLPSKETRPLGRADQDDSGIGGEDRSPPRFRSDDPKCLLFATQIFENEIFESDGLSSGMMESMSLGAPFIGDSAGLEMGSRLDARTRISPRLCRTIRAGARSARQAILFSPSDAGS